jgi:DNA-binding transcriptional LysR family regulator
MVIFGLANCCYASDMRDVTLRQLAFLAETVRTGSLSGAAAQLHLTGPAIAQQLRQLQQTVQLPLLERGPGGQRPTEAGRVLLDTYTRLTAELASCEEELDGLRAARSGRVTAGAVSTAKYFAPHILAAYQRAHPGVRISLKIGNRDEVLSQLETYAVDLAIMGRPPGELDVEQHVFGEHPYVIVAAPAHPLVGISRVPFEQIAAESLLVRELGSGTRQHLDALFERTDLQPSISMEITSNETIKQAVIAGLGIALISAHTIAAEIHDGRLAVLDVQGLPIQRHWLVVRMARRAITPATRALWEYICRDGAGQLPRLPELS